ncbi:putative Bacilysin biosynthesis oxidoreductase BacC [Xenorhabdus nematophila F1]|uniref:SDR family NAD(P)-dependent oxidoreductase n=1 Tax=Xenorhabdus nematophila TaxID=628 RepID=UPI0003275BBF|nr:SDR family oxidoreductase [Xenorhabdus nematophila]CCW33026.1 putative Bacilysin biosynthesis oxidoreductase BacC [Xenorhabdus nematophila F1]
MFTNKKCLIIGASSGLGAECANIMAEFNAELILTGRDLDRGNEVVKNIGKSAKFYQCDITIPQQINELFKHIKDKYGYLNYAINNAGITAPRASIMNIDFLSWSQIINTNLNGVLQCLKHELHLMRTIPDGAIVNVSSCAGVLAIPDQAAYCVSKAALNMLTKVAAIENAQDNGNGHAVRINAVAPGPILGGMNSIENLKSNPESTKKKIEVTAMKRMAKPEEVAKAIIFLLGSGASYMTGSIVDIDGGYSSGKYS